MINTQATPTFGNLYHSYKKRNGFPITTRNHYDRPFHKSVSYEAIERYEAKKYWAYQGAVEDHLVHYGDFPAVLHVDLDCYHDIFQTYRSGNMQFHAEGESWRTRVYTNPLWGQVFYEVNRYLCLQGLDYGTLVSLGEYNYPTAPSPYQFDENVTNILFFADVGH